ncbi:helix-turn-helix domain-containing protein [Pararhodobacter oceanensis]|uniref:helix-turn-helix domain-containing protein n=1 Tax=Pararhodobacter oceanensis TaxID=2172121 RepID=UPI003A93AE76
MAKRQTAEVFRTRLAQLQLQSNLTQTGFAQAIGIDRSALSQLSSGQNPRLPRAETLLALAQRFQVSTDWLLGMTDDRGVASQARNTVETEQALDEENRTAMERWHFESTGQKVRYVPAKLPDLMRTPAVINFQAQSSPQEQRRLQRQTDSRLHFSRMPESDIEMCMPLQTLELFANGQGIWRGLPADDRAEQLAHIAATLDELYPAFRMYLYDDRKRFAPPMTVFGYNHAAIYAGEIYLLVRSKQLVHDLAHAFDSQIRHAQINAHDAARWVRALQVTED